ncbi:MAG: uracil-DNA glycosylase [Patescibacteria group bacterium]
MNKSDELKKIHADVVALKDSPLYSYRIENKYLPVIGEGSIDAQIMFVGEAPGRNEAETGRPFCGRSGKVLDSLLASINLKREEVYITSIIKDRPQKNRDPLPEEIALYAPFLDRQIEIIKPKAVVTLGRFAMEYVMRRYGLESELAPISALHGQTFQTSNFKLIPLYHPAAAICNQKLK